MGAQEESIWAFTTAGITATMYEYLGFMSEIPRKE
jgi:hypothetical protein